MPQLQNSYGNRQLDEELDRLRRDLDILRAKVAALVLPQQIAPPPVIPPPAPLGGIPSHWVIIGAR